MVKQMVKLMESQGKKPITIHSKLGKVQAIISTGVESDLLPYEVNPFKLVDFSAVTTTEGARKEFNKEKIQH